MIYLRTTLVLQMIRNANVFLLLSVVVISLLGIKITIESNPNAYAHYFTSDQSAEFLSLIHQIDVEMALLNETFPSEIGSSYHHAKNAAELMNKTYHLTNAISAVDFRIIYEEELLNNDDNSTVQALVIANIVDEILRKYGAAYDVEYDLTNMSNVLITQSIDAHGTKSHSNSLGNNDGNKLALVSTGDYQSAQALSKVAIRIFERELSPLTRFESNKTDTNLVFVTRVKDDLEEMNNLLNNKALPEELMKMVHMQIHPGLQQTHNLESKM
jgi:hypothetical protein